MLRGTCLVQLLKPSKIKAITLSFRGKSRTEWPEGIPPKKQEFFEEKEIMTHTWTFFNAQFAINEHSHGADRFTLANTNADLSNNPRASPSLDRNLNGSISSSGNGGLLPFGASLSFGKSDGASTQMKGYRVFAAGEYMYSFELPIPSFLPETINCEMGSVRYELDATVERAGAFKSNLSGAMEVILIRTPGEASMEGSEPIAISRNWEDQLHYDIIISGKSFPIGQKIPVSFKLTPLAKVRVHRIKVFLTETVEYWCKNKKVHRLEPTRKILLLEKNAGMLGGTNESLLGNIDGASNAGSTEFDIEVKIPGCNATGRDKIHFDTTFSMIKVHHWIKIVLRLSKADPQKDDANKRRHFEISIDSPVHLLSCRCTLANTQLPTYSDASVATHARLPCPCTHSDILDPDNDLYDLPPSTPPPSPAIGTAHATESGTNRPIHLIRQPSTLPPPFSADIAPPPLMTPPPRYDYTPGARQGVLDYFTQLDIVDAEAERASDDSNVGVRPSSFSNEVFGAFNFGTNGFTAELNGSAHGGTANGYLGPPIRELRRGSVPELSRYGHGDTQARSFYSRDVYDRSLLGPSTASGKPR